LKPLRYLYGSGVLNAVKGMIEAGGVGCGERQDCEITLETVVAVVGYTHEAR
jgi:hypothetical protein